MRTQIVLRGQIFLSTQKFLLDFLLFVSKKFFSALNRSFLFPKRLILAVDLHFINWLPLVDIVLFNGGFMPPKTTGSCAHAVILCTG